MGVSVAIVMYIRYRQVAEYLTVLTTTNSVHPARVNKASLVIGLVTAFGLTLVANFQVCCFLNVDFRTSNWAADYLTCQADLGLHLEVLHFE